MRNRIAADCANEADIRSLADEAIRRLGDMWTSS